MGVAMHSIPQSRGSTLKMGSAVLLLMRAVGADVDVFGITRLMPSKLPLQEWNSAHWAEGGKRTMNPDDPRDMTLWSRKRGDGTLMEIDGAGMLRMGGNQPRIYFQSTTAKPVFFRDVEFTGYFRRVGIDGATNGGFNVGVRSTVNGHAGGKVDRDEMPVVQHSGAGECGQVGSLCGYRHRGRCPQHRRGLEKGGGNHRRGELGGSHGNLRL